MVGASRRLTPTGLEHRQRTGSPRVILPVTHSLDHEVIPKPIGQAFSPPLHKDLFLRRTHVIATAQAPCYDWEDLSIRAQMEKYAKLLRNVEHFRKLSIADLRFVINAGHLKRFQSGSVIFHETEPAAGMYVLFSGKVHLCKLSPTGQIQIISIIEPVIMFNELTAIDGGPNPFTAIAEDACLTWNIGYEAFQSLVTRYPDPAIGLALLRVLARRTRLLIDRCEDLSFRSVLARTAKVLLEMSDMVQNQSIAASIRLKTWPQILPPSRRRSAAPSASSASAA